MADAQANININLDASQALAQLRALQAEISTFQQKMLKLNASTAASAANVQRNLLNTINATGKFSAGMTTVASSTETFTNSLEKNKFSMGEYFRYAGGASKTFGKLFTNEFNTIEKVARERVKTLQTQYIKLGREANGAMKAISVRPLALDMDNLATKTMIAAQKQQILNQLLKQGSTNLLNWGKNTQWAGRQLMVGFTIPLTIFGSLAAKTFMELEEQAIRFKRVYGELFTSQEETDKMLDQLRALGSEFTKYGVALKDTMAMAADAAAMGKTGVDLLAQVSQASRLAVLGGVEQQQALETTISLTNAFGVATEDLTKKIDFLNAVENQTVVSIEDLTIAIPKAGPVVKQLGGDVEDLAFFLTAMKEGGINASEGANALKSGLASLINPSAKASEMLAGLGINIKSIVEGNAGDIKGTVIQFAQALDTLDPLNRARAIEQLFGKFQFSRLSTLFQNVVTEGTQASRVLGLTAASTEELAILSERELKRIESSPLFKFRKSFEDLKVAMAPVGEEFLKAVTPIIEFGTKLLEKFNSMSDGGKQFVTILVAGLGVVAPTLLMIIGLVGNGVANIAKFMLFLKGIGKGGAGIQQLGMQTEYMTQQQLEANAAASALSQAHSKLQQTFTSETAAVKALAAAYREAAIASRAIMSVPTARGGRARGASKPTGFANGVLSVPGPKGAGDVVPAMLSPGEAVIPAKQANKYAGFISSIMQDKVPGYRFGFNPFAMMLGRSRVAARMPQSALMSMISQGPGARYSNAFKTQTGADYLDKRGKPNPKGKALRGEMEEHIFGIDQSAGAGARPTYGYARISPIQAILNRIFGLKGKQFNAVAFGRRIGDIGTKGLIKTPSGKYIYDPTHKRDALGQYGDVDIVTKRSVSKRSTAIAGDAFLSYRHAKEHYFRGSPLIAPAPMRGATREQTKNAMFDDNIGTRWGRYNPDPINYPNAYSERTGPAYIETHTPGGFGVNEISRIIAKDRTAKKAIQEALSASGLKIRVTDQNFATKLFQALGIPGFEDGIFSVPGLKGAGDVVPAMLSPGEAVIPTKQSKKYAGFIQSIIADKVPGYYGGLFSQTMMRLAQKQAASMKLPVGASSKTDEAVVAFGAHQPFTIAHQRIADEGMALASSQQSRFMQFTTEAFGKSKKHVLPLSTKLKLIKESLGFPATAVANPFALMEKLKSQGISKVTMLLGTDRMSSSVFDKAAAEYGITLVKKEIPRGPNDVSGTETRIAIAKNDRAKFNELVASRASDSTKNQVFKEIAQNIKGYNNGVLSVPGPKGAGDVVPAMLSPGEAVIPAKQSKKYAGFIQSMIADNVPGFKGGRSGSGAEGRIGKSNFTVMRNYSANVSNTSGLAGFTGIGGQADVASAYAPQIAKAAGVSVKSLNDEINNWSNTNKKLIDDATKQFRKTGNAQASFAKVSEQFNKDMVSSGGPVSKFMSAAKTNFKQFNTDLKQAQAYAKANNIDVRAKGGTAQLAKALPGNIAAQSMATPGTFGSFAKIRGATSSMFAGGNLGKMGVPSFMLPKDLWTDSKNKDLRPVSSSQEHVAATNKQIAARKSETKATTEETKATQKSTKVKTESTRATVKSTEQSRKASQASRIESRVDSRGRTYHMLDGKRISSAQAQTAFANQERAQRGTETRAANRAAAAVPAGAQQAGARGGMGMGGVGMLAMTAGMMAPMLPGKAGEVGGQLAGPLMALGMLSMLPPKIGIVVGALALLGISIYSMVNAFSKSSKEMMTLAESLGSGSKSIAGLSEFAGTVSSGELMDRRRESMFTPYQIQPGKTTFGSSFVQSEQGTAMIESMKAALKSQGMQAVQSQVINQMSTAIATGALNPDQARSIIYELGKQLGDFSFGISVNGKLSQLIGPNGENLLTDPLGIRLKIMQESVDATQSSLEAMDTSKIGLVLGGKIAGGTAITMGSTILGAKIGAAIGTAAAPGVGTAIGAVAGAAVGIGVTALMTVKDFEKIGNLSGAIIANSVMLVQQRQQILDSLDVEYEKRISAAKAAGDVAKADELTNRHLEERQQFLSSTGQAVSDIAKQIADSPSYLFGLLGEKPALMSTLNEAVKMAYADDPLAQMAAAGTQEQIKDINFGDTEREVTLSILLASKDIAPAALSQFLTEFGDDDATIDKFLNIVTNLGGAEGGRVLQVMNLFDDDVKKTQFLAEVTARGTNATGFLDAFQQIAQVEAGGNVDIQASLDFYLNNPEILADYEADMQRLKDQAESGAISQAFIVQYIGEDVADIIATDQKYFEGLPPLQQVTYVQTIRTMFETYGEDYRETESFKSWRASQQSNVPDTAFFTQPANQLTALGATAPGINEETDTPSGGGAEPQIDSLLKKLRDLRLATIDMKKGWEGMQEVLESVFAGGTKGIDVFEGLSNQIRRMGVGENLIEMIVGMDPDEYTKRKNELFVFDKAGNIVGTTAKLKNMQSAFNAIAIGEYVNEQQRFIENAINQSRAISILTANGMSLSEAYQLVQDEALAAAIAMGATKAEIQEIIRITGLAQQQRQNMEKEQEKSRISESVRKTNEEFKNQVNILNQLSKARGQYSDAQIQAILGDPDLQKLFLNPSIDPRALQEALNNANKQANLELSIKKLTVSGQEEIFQTGLSAAMSAFSAKEQEIDIQFRATIADDESLIKSAENQLAKIDFELDDYQAALQEISWAEQKINDSYKDRFDALSRVSELNDQITASKARQLDLADALSRGDIAAAAKAAQEMRSQEQSNALETQRTMMETAQQTEIARLRSSGGLSRKQIDEKILQLEKERFGIEENTIEPAQERIRLEQIQRDLRVADLEVLGKTRDEWEAIGNRIDVAQANGWKFADAMQEALNIVETLVASLLNRPIEVEAPIPSGNGGNNQGSSAPKAVVPTPPLPDGDPNKKDYSDQIGYRPPSFQYPGSKKPAPFNPVDRGARPSTQPAPIRITVPYVPYKPPKFSPGNVNYSKYTKADGGLISRMAMGGSVKGYPMGGLIPYKSEGGFFKSLGSDTVPAMLTPGEFVVRRPAVNKMGVDKLEKINRGTYEGNSVYNYNLEVNVKSGSNPNEIANTVMRSIKQVEGRRIRGNNL